MEEPPPSASGSGPSSGGPSSPAAFPKGIPKLLEAIAKQDFGVSPDRSSALATPAMTALEAFAESHGLEVPEAARAHKKGMDLHEDYVVIRVRISPHSPTGP